MHHTNTGREVPLTTQVHQTITDSTDLQTFSTASRLLGIEVLAIINTILMVLNRSRLSERK